MTEPDLRWKTGGRDDSGRFRKGASGNPGGRPRADASVSELARERTQEALSVLTAVMQDVDAPHAARVRAAEALLDRGWGRPRQAFDAEVTQIDLTDSREKLLDLLERQANKPVSTCATA